MMLTAVYKIISMFTVGRHNRIELHILSDSLYWQIFVLIIHGG